MNDDNIFLTCVILCCISSPSDKPHNPLVNAGSIIINSLLYCLVNPDMSSSEKFDFVQSYMKVCCILAGCVNLF